MTHTQWKFNGRKSKASVIGTVALLSFAGSLIAACLACTERANADSNRVFELRVYHVVPGKLPALESRFRDTTSRLLAKHNLNVLGYWASEDAPPSDNTFIFMLAHSSREEAKKNWDAMRADPQFQDVVKSEQNEKTVEKVDVTYLRSADFSPMK